MFENVSSFEKATEMFYSMQYQDGLKLINECIQQDPKNSILYSNRALFYSQLGLVEQAFNDLESALGLNYLNYIAYFNMFSLLMRCQNFDEAFQNLCCSLSCLYLIRAKNKKSELDASKAIKYAQNNMQAHVLKGLIHLQNGKYKLALNELDWACEINPSHQIVRNIRNLIFKKMNPGLSIQEGQLMQRCPDQRRIQLRLESSYMFEEQDKEKQLRDRILEFNEIYNNLNEYHGTITTKVPKEEQNDKIIPIQQQTIEANEIIELNKVPQYDKPEPITDLQQANQQMTKHYQDQQPQLHQNQLNEPHQQISQSSHQQFYNHDENHQQHQNLNTKVEVQQNSIQNLNNAPQSTFAEQVARKLIQQGGTFYGQTINQQNQRNFKRQLNNSIRDDQSITKDDHDASRASESLVADDGVATPSRPASIAPQPGYYTSSVDLLHLETLILDNQSDKSFHSIHNKEHQSQIQRLSEFQSMINSQNHGNEINQEQNFESFISQNSHMNENQQISIISNSLYPRPQNALLQFSILKLEILSKTKQEIEAMQNLYCIANYLNVKQGASLSNFKLRTACQKGLQNGTQWNQTFDPVQIPENPECMKIKVYNKKYSSYRDDLIGQMEVQITTHGLVKLPLFNKKGDLSATLLMNLELVIKPIEQADQTEEN